MASDRGENWQKTGKNGCYRLAKGMWRANSGKGDSPRPRSKTGAKTAKGRNRNNVHEWVCMCTCVQKYQALWMLADPLLTRFLGCWTLLPSLHAILDAHLSSFPPCLPPPSLRQWPPNLEAAAVIFFQKKETKSNTPHSLQ